MPSSKMYPFYELEAGKKTNRSFTHANPGICCCPTIHISAKVLAIVDIVVHLILVIISIYRLAQIIGTETVVLIVYGVLVVICITVDVIIVVGVKRITRFLYLIFVWFLLRCVLLMTWYLVVRYYVNSFIFNRSPFRIFTPTRIFEQILWYSLELFAIFLYYSWAAWIMVAYVHLIKNAKVYVYPARRHHVRLDSA